MYPNSKNMRRVTCLLSVLLSGFLLAAAAEPDRVAQAQPLQPSSPAARGGQYEEPPVINATDLLPRSALSGPGFSVQPQVPTNGAMGQYTIADDASVFQNDTVSDRKRRPAEDA